MKQILLYCSILFAGALTFTGCENALDARHIDPDGFTDAQIEYLYSQGATKSIDNDYGTFYTQVFGLIDVYTQAIAIESGEGRASIYNISDDQGRWGYYYITQMQEFAEIDKIYNYKLSAEEQANYAPFIQTKNILAAYNTATASDFFGSMPYSEAWGIRDQLYGKTGTLTPKYDPQQDIYNSILNNLKTAAAYLKTAKLDPNITLQSTVFPKQDIVYAGNLSKWYKLANSFLLRYAMRISNVDEAKAKDVLSGLSLSDLITVNADNAYVWRLNTANTSNGIWRAIMDRANNTYFLYAPKFMVETMSAASDPRLGIFYQSASNQGGDEITIGAPIVPYPSSAADAKAIQQTLLPTQLRAKYGVINSTTFRKNFKGLPNGVGITASDVYFLLAEAKMRNLLPAAFTGTAEDYYNSGIILSIQEFYNYYIKSDYTLKNTAVTALNVSDATLKTWLSASAYKYDSSKALEQIALQKWIHTGILQPFETWAEYRRLDLPALSPDVDGGVTLNSSSNRPVRFLYPATEINMNGGNVPIADNDPKKRLWWDTK